MAMHQGFDLSRFKKVSTDAKQTTMRHANGHEVKIVHSALSPKMREQIEALPMHEPAPQNMARGGLVKKYADGTPDAPVSDDPNAMDPESPETADDVPPGGDMAAANAASRPAGIPPPPPHDEEPDPAAAAPRAAKEPDTIDVIGQKPTPTMQTLSAEDAAWQQDLRNGHITPETYSGMFGKKDTLGQIGTLFGIMAGGVGSGLTGQPNAIMQMMDKTIERDLEAQKTSKANANTFWNTAANVAHGFANADQIRENTVKNHMQNTLYAHLLGLTDKAPPANQQALAQTLQTMLPQLQVSQAQNNAKSILAANTQTGGRGGQPAFSGPVNSDVLTAAAMLDPQWVPAQKEGLHVSQTRQLFDAYRKSWERLNTMTAGQDPETVALATRAVEGIIPMGGLSPAATELAKKMQGERQAQISSLPGVPQEFLPSGFDFRPGGGDQKARNARKVAGASWFSLQEGQTPNLKLLQKHYNVVTPLPYESWAKSSPPVRTEGTKPVGGGGAGVLHAAPAPIGMGVK